MGKSNVIISSLKDEYSRFLWYWELYFGEEDIVAVYINDGLYADFNEFINDMTKNTFYKAVEVYNMLSDEENKRAIGKLTADTYENLFQWQRGELNKYKVFIGEKFIESLRAALHAVKYESKTMEDVKELIQDHFGRYKNEKNQWDNIFNWLKPIIDREPKPKQFNGN